MVEDGMGGFFNRKIIKLETEDGPVNENFIFYVNIILIWIALPLIGLLSTINYCFGLWIPNFSIFAGIAHVLLAIWAKKLYNPGLIVNLLANIPVGLWSILYLVEQGVIDHFFLNAHLLIGLGLNAILPAMGAILLKNCKKNELQET